MPSETSEAGRAARTIFHVDMDAFYASIEQRDDPAIQGRPVIVGADPKGGRGRGVVAACSYEARRFGIHSALPISQAYRLCPQGVYLRPEMKKYVAVSKEIRRVFNRFTALVEPVSIDEAFLEMSHCASPQESIERARELKHAIRTEQRLTGSVGIAPNKFLAKIASDLRKPDGLLLVDSERITEFLSPLPISRLWGVGPRTEERLHSLGIRTIGQLRETPSDDLVRQFGKLGDHLSKLAQGIDSRPIVTSRQAKSISHEHTFGEDQANPHHPLSTLEELSRKLANRLSKQGLGARTICLKLRYSDFTTITRQRSFRDPVHRSADIRGIAERIFRSAWDRSRRLRLVGISVSSLEQTNAKGQLTLF
jgi:nucleotidyltransferase/DNA polymerase involved in DNA repair